MGETVLVYSLSRYLSIGDAPCKPTPLVPLPCKGGERKEREASPLLEDSPFVRGVKELKGIGHLKYGKMDCITGVTLLYILYGEDDFSLQQYLSELKKSVGNATVLAPNTSFLEGHQLTIDQLRSVCEVVPFLADKRLVIVYGLLERFDPKPGSGRGKPTTPTRAEDHKPFSEYLRKMAGSTLLVQADAAGRVLQATPESPRTLLVLVDAVPDKKARERNPLLAEISAKAKVVTFPALKGEALRQWVQRRVAERGGTMSPAAIDLLARTVGSNLWVMANEIDKLVLFAAGRQIAEEDIRQIVSYTQEASVFNLIDAIIEFRAGVAEQLLAKLLQKGAPPAYILVMLARQVQLIVRVKELKNQGKSKNDIRNQLNITQEFVLNKALEQADRYSLPRLKEVYHKLLETDLSIKTGKYDGELALNMLIAELCQRQKQYSAP